MDNIRELETSEFIFVEKYTTFGTGIGLPISAAKVLGFLTIATPQQRTAVQVRRALGLSTGSTSTALAMLIGMHLVERVRVSGQRAPCYQLIPNGLIAATQQRLRSFKMAEEIADFGLQIAPDDNRLIAMKKLYSFMDLEMQDVLKKLDSFA